MKKKLVSILSCILLASILMTSQAFAFDEIPISQSEHMIDGIQTLVKVYEVDPALDPNTLVEENLIQNGFRYSMTGIVKEINVVEDEVEVTQEETYETSTSTESSARQEALAYFPDSLEYDQDGYTGILYPVLSSLSSASLGSTKHSGTKTTTKTYTYDYNDDSLVPTAADGYSLSSVTWSDNSDITDTSIPSSYTATATYTKPYSYSTGNGYSFVISYTGTVKTSYEDSVVYTITYTGEKIEEPGFWASLFGARGIDPDDPTSQNVGVDYKLIVIAIGCLLLALIALVFAIVSIIKFAGHARVAIYARDEMTGEYNKIKTVSFNRKTSLIKIDHLAHSAATHFRVVLKPSLAEQIKGRVVTVQCGQHIIKHQIGDAGGTEYMIDVDLDN